MHYVIVTDKTSKFGDKVNKFVFECDNIEKAKVVMLNAKNNFLSKQYAVKDRPTKPDYSLMRYIVEFVTEKDNPTYYIMA